MQKIHSVDEGECWFISIFLIWDSIPSVSRQSKNSLLCIFFSFGLSSKNINNYIAEDIFSIKNNWRKIFFRSSYIQKIGLVHWTFGHNLGQHHLIKMRVFIGLLILLVVELRSIKCSRYSHRFRPHLRMSLNLF